MISSYTFKFKQCESHQQTGVLLLPIIAISIYYTHYGTIIRYYGAIIAIIVLQLLSVLTMHFDLPMGTETRDISP